METSSKCLKKTVIFSKGPAPKHTFKFNGEDIEIVKEFNYLGFFLNENQDHSARQKSICSL